MGSGSHSSGGIGFIGLFLGFSLIIMKLTGYIDWSWWWVTVPFWGGFAIFLAVLLVVGIGIFIAELFRTKLD